MYKDRHNVADFIERSNSVVAVWVEEARGSTPRNTGAWMLVSREEIFRTIGGGSLEYMAIDKARALLKNLGDGETLSIPLGPEIGQCCGGHVRLKLERLSAEGTALFISRVERELSSHTDVYVFGAGHVGNALIESLSLLPVHPVLVDTRALELAAAPCDTDTRLVAVPEDVVRSARPGSAFIILTHDHSLDFLIATEALNRRDASYVGMIGSKTKRAVFSRWFHQQTGSSAELENLVCPIGKTTVKDKRPEVIASFVAVEVMECLVNFNQPKPSLHISRAAQEDA